MTRLFAIKQNNAIRTTYKRQDAIEESWKIAEKPDFILIGQQQLELTDFDATKRLLQPDPSLLILLLSAYETTKKAALEMGAIAFLAKPVDGKTLFNTVKRCIKSAFSLMLVVSHSNEFGTK